MNTRTLSPRALSVIDQYLHFKVGPAVCSIPYFNNKTTRTRVALRAYVGKGSPQDIFEEVQTELIKSHVSIDSLADVALKKFLTDVNLGIDCSGFAYYVMNAERIETGRGRLDRHISFVNCHGPLGKIRAKLRPVENCDVATLAHDRNSSIIPVNEIQPGDFISLVGNQSTDAGLFPSEPTDPQVRHDDRDHILVIHQVEYQNFAAYKIHYSHAVAYPEDGIYGTGVRQGTIEISDASKPITQAIWTENNLQGDANRIFVRAQKLKTEVRRLR